MKLLIEPDDGVTPIISAIRRAKKSVEIVIFRFDRKDVEGALEDAVKRSVFVHALIASANRGGEQNLRRLEMRFLSNGITVARTADDLIRYHDKMLLIDRKTLYVLSFNYTSLDIDHSRGFGIVTRNHKFVQEAAKLFEADTTRKPYVAGFENFVVSPVNARKQLSSFIKKAKKELLIYDPDVADPEMVRLLQESSKAGVDIKIIGQLRGRPNGIAVRKLTTIRLHTRTIVCDRSQVFVGSQSLRKLELDARREVGIIARDPAVVKSLCVKFDADWASLNDTADAANVPATAPKNAKQTVKRLVEELPPLATKVKSAVMKVAARTGESAFADKKVKQTVKKAVKKAFKEAMKEVDEKVAAETAPAEPK